jgi:hypothetical protein
MMTFREGAAGAVASARVYAGHLREQTLQKDMTDLARYYQRGADLNGGFVDPEVQAFAAAVVAGVMEMDDAVESLAASRIRGVLTRPALPGGDGEDRTVPTFGWLVGAGLTDFDEALHELVGADFSRAADPGTWNFEAAEERLAAKLSDAAAAASELEQAEQEGVRRRLHASLAHAVAWERVKQDGDATLAEPRADMDPRYARLMGIDPLRPVLEDELANLLSGRRADGEPIEGKQIQSATSSIADVLGLSTERLPDRRELEHVLDGRLPNGEERDSLGDKAARKLLRVLGVKNPQQVSDSERANLLDGSRATGSALVEETYLRKIEATKVAISFIDCCFSADKSVSLAWAFAPTEAERNIVLQAHRDAVDSAMAHVGDVLGQASRGKAAKGGREHGEVGWVRFDHFASRPTVKIARFDEKTGEAYTDLVTLKVAGDPQLHTHVAMPNVVLLQDGKVGALDFVGLHGRVKEFGGYYQAHLATNLRAAGIEVEVDPRTGSARIPSISDEVRDEFSKRTRDALGAARAYAADRGLSWDNLDAEAQVALLKGGALSSRTSKTDDLSDFVAWRAQAQELGWKHASVMGTNDAPVLSEQERMDYAWASSLAFLDADLQRRAQIEGGDARVAACRGLVASGVRGPEDIDKLTHAFRDYGVQQHGEWTSLIWGTERVMGRERIVITTAMHENEERELVGLVKRANADLSAALTPTQIADGVRAHPDLDFSSKHGQAQREAMDRLGGGGRFEVFIAAAGAGKSSLLRPLVTSWQAEGREVYGMSLAWRQTDALADAGISVDQRTRDRNRAAVQPFIERVKQGTYKLDQNSVVVIDELGLLGTRQLLDIMRLQERHGFSVVALGDDRQCQSLEAGPVIRLIEKALGDEAIPKLLTTVRQETERERTIAGLFREGKAAEALTMKREDGTAVAVPGDYMQAVEHVARLWDERRKANVEDPSYRITISAPTNEDARHIAAAVREIRRAAGEIGQEDKAVIQATDLSGENRYSIPIAVGDRVRLYASTRASFGPGLPAGNIGRNASVLTVEDVGDRGITLRNHKGRVGLVSWETLRHPENGRIRLSYGDVLTIDSSQGDTVTEHIHAMPGGTRHVNGFKAYVAESRHRRTTWLVTSEGAERQQIKNDRPLGDMRLIRTKDIWDNMATNLSRMPEKVSALGMLDRVKAVRRESALMMQQGLQASEARAASGRPRTTLRERLVQRHRRTAMSGFKADRAEARQAADTAAHSPPLPRSGPRITGL